MLKLLIVEDDIIDQLALTRLIKKNNLDCEVTVSLKITEAKELITNNDFDLVICDLNLPDGKAFDLGPLIKKQAFILLSGHLEEEIITEATNFGAIQVLQKSSELTQLTSIHQLIKEMLNEKETISTKPSDQKIVNISKFNIQLLMKTFDQKPEPVVEILEAVLTETPKMIDQINAAIDSEGRTTIKRIAHRLKSNYIMIGLKEQHKIAEKIEHLSTSANLSLVKVDLLKLKSSLSSIYPELETALNTLKKNTL